MSPSRRLLWVFLLVAIPLAIPALVVPFGGLPPTVERLLWRFGIVANLGVLIVAIHDLWRSPGLAGLVVVREAPAVMSVGAPNRIRVWLNNRGLSELELEIQDSPPQPARVEGLPTMVPVCAGGSQEVIYQIVPLRRGAHRFGPLFVRTRSRLGLWNYQEEHGRAQEVKVFPDIQSVGRLELLLRDNRLSELGIRRSRIRDRGSEFERLREYRRGDESRAIDWKATARQRQLISREYTLEKNQTVCLVLDSGGSMCNEDDGIRHFDRALNSAMVFAYLALRQGDSVGMMVASNRLERWIRPTHGVGAIQPLVRSTYDLEASHVATDYQRVADEIRQRVRKRSLIVFLTHAMDELQLEDAVLPLRALSPPHLVLVACLRNVRLEERGRLRPQNDLEALQIGAANVFLLQQARAISEMNASGVRVIDVLPHQLTGELVSQYLEIKSRQLL
jgi:uncharacterized protein (DUF58 family)